MDKKKKLQKHSKHHSKKHMKEMKSDMKKGDSFSKAHKKALKKVGKQWLKNLNHFKQEISLKKEAHGNIKKIKINRKNVKKNRLATKDRVDKHPLVSYIQDMKVIKEKTMKNNFEKRYAKGIKLDVRNKGTCYVTMKTNAGELTVYIDAMDGLTDPPMVRAWIPGRRDREINLK